MDTRKIKKLIELVKETGIGELEVKSGEESVRISTMPAAAPIAVAPAAVVNTHPPAHSAAPTEKQAVKEQTPEGHEVKSPMVGTAYLAAQPGSPPFVKVGQHVNIGDTLCLIEAMKMFNKIEADTTGVLSARLIDNGQPVEYDQTLFIIDTAG